MHCLTRGSITTLKGNIICVCMLVTQSCLTLCNPMDLLLCPTLRHHRRKPTRLPCPWDSPGKNTGVGCHFLLHCIKVKVKLLSCVRLFETPWTAAYHAPPSMGFSKQEYWSGVPFHVWLSATLWNVTCQAPLSMGFSRQEYWSGLHALLQGIFPTQGLNPGLLHYRQILYHLSFPSIKKGNPSL